MKFYTGLPSIKVLKAVVRRLIKHVPTSAVASLSPFQEFVAICLNCPVQVLAYCLIVSCAILYHKCF